MCRKMSYILKYEKGRGYRFMHVQDFIGETNEYDKKERLEEKRPKSWCKSVVPLPMEKVAH